MKYGYDIYNHLGGVYTRRGIRDEALKLLEGLLEFRKAENKVSLRDLRSNIKF